MLNRSRAVAILFLLCLGSIDERKSLAQEPGASPVDKVGSIAGRITISDAPAAGIPVVLFDFSRPQGEILARTTTAKDGRYLLTKLPSMRYWLRVLAPSYIDPLSAIEPGRGVSLPEGGSIENVDLALIPGGEISGRVVDADGHAVVGQTVFLFGAEGWLPGSHPCPQCGMYAQNGLNAITDSTGAYKIIGIRPGRYLAGTGVDVAVVTGAYWTPYDGGQHTGRVEGDPSFARTFYPDVTNFSEAKPIEVGSGGHTRGVNINAGRPLKTYSVSGRIIDAESRRPMGDCAISMGHIYGTATSGGMSEYVLRRTLSDGSFKVSGLLPGRFMIGAAGECGRDKYTRMIDFDVNESDVTGLEIEALRGTTLQGRVVVQNGSGPEAIQKLALVRLSSTMATSDRGNNGYDQRETGVGQDGSFIIGGLPAGKAMIRLAPSPVVEEFSIVRVDHPNAKERCSIDIGPELAITGVQVVLRYNSSVVQGRVEFEGGKLAPEMFIKANISCECDGDRFGLQTPVDPNGNFVFKSLPPGNHTVYLSLYGIDPITDKKSVVVEDKAETHVEFVFDVRGLKKNNEK